MTTQTFRDIGATAPDFEAVFGRRPDLAATAHGRVNMLGEHTDYNDGFVLPAIIPQATTVQLARSEAPGVQLYAAELGELCDFALDNKPEPHFSHYVFGCLQLLQQRGAELPGLMIHVTSQVPMGVGLSSSAALEVALLRGMRRLLQLDLDDVTIARLAQRAEIEFAGVNCGIMDQMASSLARADSMLFLDTRTLQRQLVPLPVGSEILVVDSGIARTLAASKYNERRAECEEAARRLGVAALRDVHDPRACASLPEPMRRRARHVISENNRVLEARQGISAERFGMLMNESHASLRDDYEVSVAPLDLLVGMLQRNPGVYGARLTGAGFGGACVALCRAGQAARVGAEVARLYAATGHEGRVLVPEPVFQHPEGVV